MIGLKALNYVLTDFFETPLLRVFKINDTVVKNFQFGCSQT